MYQPTVPSGDGKHPALAASNAECMLRLRARDLCALESLYNRHHGYALALASRLSHDPAQIEQAVEDTFLLVWRLADRYQPAHATPRDWLLGIVAWRCRALNCAPASAGPDFLFESATAGAQAAG
jgi:hypothetical protein